MALITTFSTAFHVRFCFLRFLARSAGEDFDGFSFPGGLPRVRVNFTPMYNLNYKLRLGVCLWMGRLTGANLYTDGDVYGSVDKSDIVRPSLGISLP